jgi:hypothetical protein
MATKRFYELCEQGNKDLIHKQYEVIKNEKHLTTLLLTGIQYASKTCDPHLITWFLSLKPSSNIFTFFSDQRPYIKFNNKLKIDLFCIASKNNNLKLAQYLFVQIEQFPQELFINVFNDVFKLGHIDVVMWMYSIYNFKELLLTNEIILECCKSDNINIFRWICSVCNILAILILCFECACESGAINIAIFLHQVYPEIINCELGQITNKLLVKSNINKVFKWISTFYQINYTPFQTYEYTKNLIEHNSIETLLFLINSDFVFPCECYNTLLKYACCNTNCINLITTAITKISDFTNVNIDDIYLTTCCIGNYEVTRFLQENFAINIRKHNDLEFMYNCVLLTNSDVNKLNNDIVLYVETNVLNHKYINKAKITIDRLRLVMWMSSICADYKIIMNTESMNNEIKNISVDLLITKAVKSHKAKNTFKSIGILGIKKTLDHKISHDTMCFCCLDLCENLIYTNCKHYMCFDRMLEWFGKPNTFCKCPLCLQLIIFSECQIVN